MPGLTTPFPDLHALTGGGYSILCGRCLASGSRPGTSPENAWDQLRAAGWTWYVSAYGGRGYSICKRCSEAPLDLAAAVKNAHESRKKKGRRG